MATSGLSVLRLKDSSESGELLRPPSLNSEGGKAHSLLKENAETAMQRKKNSGTAGPAIPTYVLVFLVSVTLFYSLIAFACTRVDNSLIEPIGNRYMDEDIQKWEVAYAPAVATERPSEAHLQPIHIEDEDSLDIVGQEIDNPDTPTELDISAVPTDSVPELTPTEPITAQQSDADSEQPQPSAATWSAADVDILCKTVYGEAGNVSKDQMAAVAWCVLNRVDSSIYPNDIISVATQPGQFQGYQWWHPVDPDVKEIVLDVLDRWQREKNGEKDVGRILPPEYLFFWGDNVVNHFTVSFGAETEWDWSWPSPYQDKN